MTVTFYRHNSASATRPEDDTTPLHDYGHGLSTFGRLIRRVLRRFKP